MKVEVAVGIDKAGVCSAGSEESTIRAVGDPLVLPHGGEGGETVHEVVLTFGGFEGVVEDVIL
jgi:hypothetical protein